MIPYYRWIEQQNNIDLFKQIDGNSFVLFCNGRQFLNNGYSNHKIPGMFCNQTFF